MAAERFFVPLSLLVSAEEVALASHFRAHGWFVAVSLFLAAANSAEAIRIVSRSPAEEAD